MAYIKSYNSEFVGAEFANAYHRATVDDSMAHFGVLRLSVDVFANKQAAQPPTKVLGFKMDENGEHLFEYNAEGNPIAHVMEEMPGDHRRSVGQPIGQYYVEIWNRQPPGRKPNDGGTQYIFDAEKFDALLNRADPIPGGATNKEKFSPKAQAYRLLKSLPEFADGVDDK